MIKSFIRELENGRMGPEVLDEFDNTIGRLVVRIGKLVIFNLRYAVLLLLVVEWHFCQPV